MARSVFNLDKDWKFHLGELKGNLEITHNDSYHLSKAGGAGGYATKEGIDTEDWQSVDLPHDYFVETDFRPENLLSHGYKTRDNGWYRKTFRVDEALRGKSATLVFEGLSVAATVYLNGSVAGRSFSAYAELALDVTDRLYYGEEINTLAVHIDGLTTEGWWYEGAGIYRHVMLYCKDLLHIEQNGLWVKPELNAGTENDWTVSLETTVKNSAYAPDAFAVHAVISDGETVLAENTSAVQTCEADLSAVCTQKLSVADPTRWDIDAPKLYTLRAELLRNGEVIDCETTKFGFRTIAIDAEKGFFLNGRPLKLKGTCNHQDHAGVGVAVPDSVQYYRIRRLKEMGSNAYRCAHNMPTKAVLDACDAYGMIVMDENRRFECTPEVLGHVETMIRRDRNHPCVAFYSLFNEEPLQSTPEGKRIYQRMYALVKRLDDTRLLTGALNAAPNSEGSALDMDVMGINYGIDSVAAHHEKYPTHPLIGSENNSAVSTRGCYRSDYQTAHVLDNYGGEVVPWGQSIYKTWDFTRKHDYMAGIFIWTGFDYRGEPTPFEWPSCSSQFGIMDTCGFAKDSFYLNRACFVSEPMMHIFPHWNWKNGDSVRVMLANNCEEAELFLNGRSLGRKPSDVCAPCEWTVEFAPGTLRAVGYRGGKAVITDEVQTTGEPVRVVIEPDRTWIGDDGEDTVPLKIYVTDAQGRAVPTASNHIKFTVSGDGKVLGVGNGDPNSHESDKLPERDLYCGLCQALIMADLNAETLTVTAESDGLASDTFTFAVRKTAHPEYIFRTVNNMIGWVLISQENAAERPDPNAYYADNDMNSFAALSVQSHIPAQEEFTEGWRMYRIPVKYPKNADKSAYFLHIGLLTCAAAEAWLDGRQIWHCAESAAPADIALPVFPGENKELRLIVRAIPGQASGLGRALSFIGN